jgi:hypothetical protein
VTILHGTSAVSIHESSGLGGVLVRTIHALEDLVDHIVGTDVLRLALKIQDQPMPQHMVCHLSQVIAGDVITLV